MGFQRSRSHSTLMPMACWRSQPRTGATTRRRASPSTTTTIDSRQRTWRGCWQRRKNGQRRTSFRRRRLRRETSWSSTATLSRDRWRTRNNWEERFRRRIRKKILEIVEDKLSWLKENEEASAEEMQSAKKDIEDIAQPIIAALYQNQQQSSDNSHTGEE